MESYEDGSAEWHRSRSKGIGGSDAATILGLEPFGKTREELWRAKMGEDIGSAYIPKEYAEFGTALEPYIFEEVGKEYSVIGTRGQIQHPELAWMLGYTDGRLRKGRGEGVLEIKTCSDPPPADRCDDIHYPQGQHYLAITGLGYVLFAYFVAPFSRKYAMKIRSLFIRERDLSGYLDFIASEGDIHLRLIERNDSYIEHLIKTEKKFWECVVDGTPPAPLLPKGEVEVDDLEMKRLLLEYGKAHKEIKSVSTPEKPLEAKKKAGEDIKRLATVIAAGEDDVKKIHVPGGGSLTWNSRGYWMIYPEKKSIPEVTPVDERPF